VGLEWAGGSLTAPRAGASYGHSLIINPWGEVLADGRDQAGVISAAIDLEEVLMARGRIPSLNHDRSFEMAEGTKIGTE